MVSASATPRVMGAISARSRSRVAGMLRREWVLVVAGAVLLVVALFAILDPVIVPVDLGFTDLANSFAPPAWAGGTWTHPLGTDNLGHDTLSQLAYGARSSLVVAVAAAFGAGVIGTAVGLISGYLGGVLDGIVSQLAAAQLALPLIFVAIAIAMVLGPSQLTVIIAISFANWVPFARVVRAETMVLRESDFVSLARLSGSSTPRLLARHILPNTRRSIIVLATQAFGEGILMESSLGYLGLGVQPPDVSLGLMIANAQIYISSDPRLIIAPVVLLAAAALSANLVGDRVNDLFDPMNVGR